MTLDPARWPGLFWPAVGISVTAGRVGGMVVVAANLGFHWGFYR